MEVGWLLPNAIAAFRSTQRAGTMAAGPVRLRIDEVPKIDHIALFAAVFADILPGTFTFLAADLIDDRLELGIFGDQLPDLQLQQV